MKPAFRKRNYPPPPDATRKDITIKLPYAYQCRDYQIPFWEAMRHKKRCVLVWHRRAGKEKTCWNYLIMKAIQKVGTYYYFFPHFSQGRKILWDGVDKDGFRFLDHIPKDLVEGVPNSTEMKIRLKNGSLIQIIGTNNVDSIMGTNPIGCVFTEYSLQDPKAWSLIRPILVENGGWAVFNFTPRGANHGKDIFDMAQANPEWFCQLLTVKDTCVVSEADIKRERDSGMSEDFIQQEFYCSFTLGVEGSYYARYMQEARDEERIGNVPWNKQSRVYTAWDIGFGDSTAIIFYQVIGQEIHVIDFYEAHGEGLPHYAGVLKDKPYIYADHFAPHDIDSHAFSSGLSAREVGSSLGIKFITLPTLKLRLEDGIEAVRGLFPRVWIDATKCKHLIKCLENYRKEFDERMETYRERPRHDKYSHGCFIGETRIMTGQGEVCIDQIKTGDYVRTPNGLKKVLSVFEYEVKDLVKVTTTSSEFVCTGNHKIFTNKGLIHADAMRYDTSLVTVKDEETCRRLVSSISMDPSIGFRESFLSAMTSLKSYSTDTALGGMEDTTEGGERQKILIKNCTAVSGPLTWEKFQKAIISIIKTITPRTTTLVTCSASAPASTRYCMARQTPGLGVMQTGNNFSPSWGMPLNGIVLSREENGIKSTLRNTGSGLYLKLRKFASYALAFIGLQNQTRLTAQMVADKGQGISAGSITRPGCVKSAHQNSLLTGMPSKELVVNVVPFCSQIIQKVYDIEVEDDHCYYANGILVSNSDAMRYLAIAVKLNVDSLNSGISDRQSEAWFKQFNPVFD